MGGKGSEAIGDMDHYLNPGVVRLEWLVSSKFGSSWMIRNKVGRLALDCRDLLTTHDGFASFIWYKVGVDTLRILRTFKEILTDLLHEM